MLDNLMDIESIPFDIQFGLVGKDGLRIRLTTNEVVETYRKNLEV